MTIVPGSQLDETSLEQLAVALGANTTELDALLTRAGDGTVTRAEIHDVRSGVLYRAYEWGTDTMRLGAVFPFDSSELLATTENGRVSECRDRSYSCLFGASTASWQPTEGPDLGGDLDLDVEEDWTLVTAVSQPTSLELAQMLEALAYPEADIATLDELLDRTDDRQFLRRALVHRRTGDRYLAWAYSGGGNLHGAIFASGSAEPAAKIGDERIFHCEVSRLDAPVACTYEKAALSNTPATSTKLPNSSSFVEVTALDRTEPGSLGAGETLWYELRFEAGDGPCFTCFLPYAALLLPRGTPVGTAEVCVFVDAYEAEARGPIECFNGAASAEEGLLGCCTAESPPALGDLFDAGDVILWNDWSHQVGESSRMFIRVRNEGGQCLPYTLVYGHFRG